MSFRAWFGYYIRWSGTSGRNNEQGASARSRFRCTPEKVEKRMSKSVRLVLVLAMVSAIAACAEKVEPVEPIIPEVADSGKY